MMLLSNYGGNTEVELSVNSASVYRFVQRRLAEVCFLCTLTLPGSGRQKVSAISSLIGQLGERGTEKAATCLHIGPAQICLRKGKSET